MSSPHSPQSVIAFNGPIAMKYGAYPLGAAQCTDGFVGDVSSATGTNYHRARHRRPPSV